MKTHKWHDSMKQTTILILCFFIAMLAFLPKEALAESTEPEYLPITWTEEDNIYTYVIDEPEDTTGQFDGREVNVYWMYIPAKYKMHYRYGWNKVMQVEGTVKNAADIGDTTLAINTQLLGFPKIGDTYYNKYKQTLPEGYDWKISVNDSWNPETDPIYEALEVTGTNDPTDPEAGMSFADINFGFDYSGLHVPYNCTDTAGAEYDLDIYMALFSQLVMNGEEIDEQAAANSYHTIDEDTGEEHADGYLVERHPRTWIAYDYEDNQYVMVCDGGDHYPRAGKVRAGLNYKEMIEVTKQIMVERGADPSIKTLYNLDGGGSSAFVYRGERKNPPLHWDSKQQKYIDRPIYGVFYWKVEKRKVTTRHFLKDSETKVAEDSVQVMSEGTYYETSALDDGHLILQGTPENAEGELSGNVIVDYYYDHPWDEGRVTREPTTTEEGEKTYTCTKCDETKTEAIPALIDVSLTTASGVTDKVHTGKAQTLENLALAFDGSTLVEGTDYTVEYANNVNVGTASITITGKGSYGGTKSITFKILGDLSKGATIGTLSDQTYTGKAITPAPTVKYAGKTLKSGTDYTVGYANNTNVGTATVTVTGKGNYKNSVKATFKILGNLATGATIEKLSNYAYQGGKAITPAPTVKFAGRTLRKGTDYTVSYANNKKIGTATVTVKGMGSYKGSKSATFKIVAPTWSGATSMPVNSTGKYAVKGGTIRVKKGSGGVLSLKSNVVTAKKAGTGYLELLDRSGKVYATRKVSVFSLTGNYVLESAANSGLVLDIQGSSKANSAKMLVYKRHGGKNQLYQFIASKDGSYYIKCVHSGKYVDVQGKGTKAGQNVIQYGWNGGKNQRWKITVDAKNQVEFISSNSGMVFTISGYKAISGKTMIQWPDAEASYQKWVLRRK